MLTVAILVFVVTLLRRGLPDEERREEDGSARDEARKLWKLLRLALALPVYGLGLLVPFFITNH